MMRRLGSLLFAISARNESSDRPRSTLACPFRARAVRPLRRASVRLAEIQIFAGRSSGSAPRLGQPRHLRNAGRRRCWWARKGTDSFGRDTLAVHSGAQPGAPMRAPAALRSDRPDSVRSNPRRRAAPEYRAPPSRPGSRQARELRARCDETSWTQSSLGACGHA